MKTRTTTARFVQNSCLSMALFLMMGTIAHGQLASINPSNAGDASVMSIVANEYGIDYGRFVDAAALDRAIFQAQLINGTNYSLTTTGDAVFYNPNTSLTSTTSITGSSGAFIFPLGVGIDPNASFTAGQAVSGTWVTDYQGTTPVNYTSTISGTKVDDRVISAATPATITLGRVYRSSSNVSAAINVDVTTSGAQSDFTDLEMATGTTTATSTGDSTTQTLSTSPVSFNNASATATVTNLDFTFNTRGAKSGQAFVTATVDEDAPGASDATAAVANFTATAVDARTLSASTINFGRVVRGNSYTGSTTITTNGSDDEFTRVTLTGNATNASFTGLNAGGTVVLGSGTQTEFNSSSVSETRDLTIYIAPTQFTLGNISRTANFAPAVTQEALTDAPAATLGVGYTATVLQTRTFSHGHDSAANPYNFKALVNVDDQATGFNVNTTGSDSTTTRVRMDAGSTTSADGIVTLTSPLTRNFAGFITSGSIDMTANHDTSGTFTGSVNAADLFTDLEAPSTQATFDDVSFFYNAEIFEAANVSGNNSTALSEGDQASLSNTSAVGAQRAAAEIASTTIDETRFTLGSGLDNGTQIAAGGSTSATVSVDQTGLLNGTVLSGILTANLEHADQTIAGTSTGDLGSIDWNLVHTVVGNVASSGNSDVGNGDSYAGLNLNSGGQQATLAEGTATAATTVEMSFNAAPATTVTNDTLRVGDVLTLNGTDGDIVVLQMSYDPASLVSVNEQDLRLSWLDTSSDEWVLAIDGNTGGSPALIQDAYNNSHFTLGNHGIDTVNNTVWAVINHNSDFAVTVIPEPTSLVLLGLGSLGLLARRRGR